MKLTIKRSSDTRGSETARPHTQCIDTQAVVIIQTHVRIPCATLKEDEMKDEWEKVQKIANLV